MFRLFSLAIISIISIYAIESVVQQTIKGKITHVGSKTIDKNSKVEVSLRDVSLMDTASKLISSTIISDAKTFPISYELKYDPSQIKRGMTYALSARITGPDNNLLFITDVRTVAQLIGNPSPTIDIPVVRTGGSSSIVETKVNDSKACKPVKCPGKPKVCAYGYQKKGGCEICKCNDPCNPPGKAVICPSNQRCFVEKKTDGTFGTRCDTASSKNNKGDKSSPTADCNLPKLVGTCRASIARFYYNSATKKCESFDYGGCRGNANNFETKAICEANCKA